MASSTKRLQSTPCYVANSNLDTYFTVAVPSTQKDQIGSLVGCHVTHRYTFRLRLQYQNARFRQNVKQIIVPTGGRRQFH